VVGPGVCLNDETLLTPEEIDFVAADLGVHLRGGDAVVGEEGEEGGLEIRAGAVGLDPVEAETLELRLADRATN
jgi:hypothetical protein